VKTIISNSADETIQIAERIAPILKTRDVIILVGDLGSGKTKFVEGILKYFGLENEISSPTFTIVNEYNAKHQNIYHFDVYRLEDTDEFYAIGGEEYFDKGICLIEWGEQIKDALPINYKKIIFSRDLEHENMRVLNFEGFDETEI
jgi:tRNA threonylcarbamoyladenosine biosynthesis protein TsaE